MRPYKIIHVADPATEHLHYTKRFPEAFGRHGASGHNVFDLTVPSLSNCVSISNLTLKDVCDGTVFWKNQLLGKMSHNFLFIPMHEALPDVNTIHVIDWKIHADTITPEICAYIKKFLANNVQEKQLHFCNRLSPRKPVWSPDWYPVILDVINSPTIGNIILDFIYRSEDEYCSEHVKKDYLRFLKNINVANYRKVYLGFQQWPDDGAEIIAQTDKDNEMKPYKIIQALESDNSRLNKEAIVAKAATNKVEEFFDGCRLALDPLITFGVKNVPFTKTDGAGLGVDSFLELATSLEARSLTGHAARDAVQSCADKATIEEWNDWYRRILIKDLRCGTSEKTINNVVKKINKDYMVPVFGCMLAHDGAKHKRKIKGDCLVEYKYDGVRVIAIVQNDSATLYSRNGKILTNFPHIEEALSKPYFNDYVFDGEVMSEDFQALMKQVHRKSGAKTDDAYLALFDVLSLDEFNKGKSINTAIERKQRLADMKGNWNLFTPFVHEHNSPIRIVDYHEINFDTDKGQAQFKELNKTALEKGYEGLMIKPVDALYECKRSHAWLKIKPFIEVTLEIVDTEEGTGKNKGKLGALICEGTDDGVFIQVNVGSGLSDNQRETFWAVKDALIGELAEVMADAITQNQDGTYSLRFPRFKTFRGFEVGEKL